MTNTESRTNILLVLLICIVTTCEWPSVSDPPIKYTTPMTLGLCLIPLTKQHILPNLRDFFAIKGKRLIFTNFETWVQLRKPGGFSTVLPVGLRNSVWMQKTYGSRVQALQIRNCMTLIYIAWCATAAVEVGSLCRPAKFFHTKPLLYGFVCGDIVMMEQETCSSNCNHRAGSTHLSKISLHVVAIGFPFRERGANLKQTLTEIRQKYVDSSSTEGMM